ncbi:MAG TPA: hypothetical protein VJ302_16915 [Blastocatellia bacterium]|nr:hypothetical protein [Blastocatellia bacterium]
MLVLAGCAAAVSVSFATLSFYKYRQSPETATQATSPTASSTAASPSPPSSPRPTVTTTASPLPTPIPTPQTRLETIVNDSIVVRPGHFQSYRFVVKNEYRNARATGQITASGGNRNDIVVIIVDDQGLKEFSDEGNGAAYFRSTVESSDNLDVPLPPGVYHVILSNNHARFFKKSVKARLYLEYD